MGAGEGPILGGGAEGSGCRLGFFILGLFVELFLRVIKVRSCGFLHPFNPPLRG